MQLLHLRGKLLHAEPQRPDARRFVGVVIVAHGLFHFLLKLLSVRLANVLFAQLNCGCCG